MKMKCSISPTKNLILICMCVLLTLVGCTEQGSANRPSSSADEQLEASDYQIEESDPDAGISPSSENEDEQANAGGAATSHARLLGDFAVISQYPELPNGCEVTTLAAVLNYLGISADKTVLSDQYLPKAPVGSANFYREFVGDPRNSDAYGCYAPVIETTANLYLGAVGSPLSAHNVTGTSLEDLFSYIDSGSPVIIWATQYNQTGHYSVTWYVDGQALTWFTPEHCVALIGYDLDQGLVYVADPMTGQCEAYDLASFAANYDSLGQQAIVIE